MNTMQPKMKVARLLKLADFLETVPRKKFNLGTWGNDAKCSTAGCAAGWGCQIPSFRKSGLRLVTNHYYGDVEPYCRSTGSNGFDAVSDFFGLTGRQTEHVFSLLAYQTEPTPKQVAGRIRALVRDFYKAQGKSL